MDKPIIDYTVDMKWKTMITAQQALTLTKYVKDSLNGIIEHAWRSIINAAQKGRSGVEIKVSRDLFYDLSEYLSARGYQIITMEQFQEPPNMISIYITWAYADEQPRKSN